MGDKLAARVVMVARPTSTLPDLSFEARNATEQDVEALAELMWVSYRGTIDDKGETHEETVRELLGFARSKYGPPLWECSFIAVENSRPVSAVLVCEEDGKPLLAYIFTHPDCRNRGFVTGLTKQVLNALHARGYTIARLRVTRGNEPAEHVYRKLGFRAE